MSVGVLLGVVVGVCVLAVCSVCYVVPEIQKYLKLEPLTVALDLGYVSYEYLPCSACVFCFGGGKNIDFLRAVWNVAFTCNVDKEVPALLPVGLLV